ncbi:MAG: IS5 family transposase [Oscillospiraceae bacterium]|nr:IS5 family transposase [Oscillospiraceae bacterium]
MIQLNILAESNRLSRLSEIGDKLETIQKAPIKWDQFKRILDEAIPDKTKEGKGGRPPYDKLMMFKICLLQSWYGLSDEQLEFQINDRLSFQRFLGIDLSTKVPDKNTIWMFKESMTNSVVDYDIFDLFVKELEEMGIITRKGSIIDATFVEVPRQRNTREENAKIKTGEKPEEWSKKKQSHKDLDARWTKKNDKTYYGYKDHIKVDRDSKIIIDFDVTSANVHDSQVAIELVDKKDEEIWMDSAYAGQEEKILEKNEKIILQINEKGCKNKSLTEEQKESNIEKSKIRARIEHVNGQMTVCGSLFVRNIGKMRVGTAICLKNIAYNISRFAYLTVKKPKLT